MWLGLLYSYFFHVLEAPIPDRTARNPYTLKPDIWPKAIIIGASFILEPLGYMATCCLVLFLYGLLLGQTHVIRLAVFSVVITFVLYVVFSVLLSVNLPRGTVEACRNFSLYVEGIVASVQSAIGM